MTAAGGARTELPSRSGASLAQRVSGS